MHDRQHWRLVTAAGLGLGAISARASAADGPVVELTWNAPAGCPSRDAVLEDVRRSVGDRVAHRVVARASVEHQGPTRWSVHLATGVDGVAGERSLEADSCASLANATALILAWAVDPTRAQPEEPRVLAPARASVDQETHRPVPARASEVAYGIVAASGQLDVGILPSGAGAGEVAVGVLLGPIRAELSGSDWLTQDAHQAAGGTHVHLLEGALRVCIRGRLGATFELAPCLGAGLVHASSDGFDVSIPFQRTSNWGTARAEIVAGWGVVGPLALRASAGVVAPLVRPSFVVVDPKNQEIPLHRAAVASLRATLGVEAHFP